MPDLKTFYDRYLLAAAGVLAAVVAVLLAFAAGSEKEAAVLLPLKGRGADFSPNPDVVTLQADGSALAERRSWSEREDGASLLVSRVYLLKDDRLVDILEAGNELFPGIPNSWIMEHGLDYLDAGLPDADPDADGFTNLEEYAAKTNPRDAASKPALWTKLRLTDSKVEKLRFKFESLPGGSLAQVSINTVSAENPSKLSGSTQFYPRSAKKVKTSKGEKEVDPRTILLADRTAAGSEVLEPTPFKFERAEMADRFNPATNVQEKVPVVVLRNTADGKEIQLELHQVKDSPYALATLQDTRTGGKAYELRVGETLQLGDSDTYKLVDVSEEKATIESLATKEQHTVPKAAPASAEPTTPPAEQPQ